MNFKGEQAMGFALFSSAAMAMSARDALQVFVISVQSSFLLKASCNVVLRKQLKVRVLHVQSFPTCFSGLDIMQI